MPPSAFAPRHAPPFRHHSTSTTSPASSRASASSTVFIDTANAAPTASPSTNSRRAVSGPQTAMATTASHAVIHSSSVRNSTVFKSSSGKNPASTAAHQPARGENSAVPIFATSQSVAANSGSIARRM